MPDRLIEKLSRKAKWWMAAGFVLGTCLTMIFLVGLTIDQRNEIADLRAAAAAEVVAEKATQNSQAVVSCLRGVYDVPDFVEALGGLDVVLTNQIEALTESLVREPDTLVEERKQRLRRATRAQVALARLLTGEDGLGGIAAQRKTLDECRTLAAELDVEFEPLAKQAADR